MVLLYNCHEIYEDFEGGRVNKKKKTHLRGHQPNVTIFSRNFSKPANQTINNDRSLIY